ncbi:MAG: hypothetical protein IPP56_02870 [Bacteroidetes bacterium]|nr:hypothetical protein [Bacteroidota bacterium]
MNTKFFFTLLLLVYLSSCASPGQKTDPNKQVETANQNGSNNYQKIEKGKIVNPVICGADAKQSYAAYLPSNYDSLLKYPVLIAFDAHAGGRIPVELYHLLAEEYGYIIVGSNNSKNGLDAASLTSIANTFISDIIQRFAIDERRMYVCGFSGGARVAASVAQQGGIAGLASCSAGFEPMGSMSFNFIGFAGNEDFNSNEMIELTKKLDMTNIQHQLILFNGKHEWPIAEVFEDAFIWFEFSAMKDKLIPTNSELVKKYLTKAEAIVEKFKQSKNYYEAYTEADKTGNFVYGLIDCNSILATRTQLESMPELKRIFLEKSTIEKREREVQNFYRQALQERDIAWWNTEIKSLLEQTRNKNLPNEERRMLKRSVSFLSLLFYMASYSTVNQNQLQQAIGYLHLYEQVDPENTEVYYLQARVAAKNKDASNSISLLLKAIDLGFTDNARVQNETDFSFLQNESAMQELLTKMSTNQQK